MGNVRDTSDLFVNKVTSGTIETTTGETPYVRFGDWVVLLCGLGLVATAVVGTVRRRGEGVETPDAS